MQIHLAYNQGADSKNTQQSADWLRLVKCIFQGIPSLTLQLYIIILSQEYQPYRVWAVLLGMVSMSVNSALIFSTDQPGTMPTVYS